MRCLIPPALLSALVLAALSGSTLASPTLASLGQDPIVAEETMTWFGQNCASCHTIGGGRLTGPDLKDADKRQEREWLIAFMQDPKKVLDSGDAYAAQLVEEARGVVMPTLPGLTRSLAEKLVDLITVESALEKSHFAGLVISERPLTDADVERGRMLFTGAMPFQGGAPACISCHTTISVPALGGGTLGPDLSTVYSRLEGRKGLAAWLAAPPSAVMQPVFRDKGLESEEILALVAWLRKDAEQGQSKAEPSSLGFVLAGILTAGVMLGLFDLLWRDRFRSVRPTLTYRR